MIFETLGQLWPLQSGSGNQPTLTPGKTTTFQYNDVPDRCPTGPLANYMPGTEVTFYGNVVQPSEGGAVIHGDTFFAALFSSLQQIQAWHGTPVASQHVLGAQWYVTEYFVNGFRYQDDLRAVVAPAGAGTYPFEITIFVPFSSCRIGELEDYTSQLALLARTSQLQINVAPASVIDSLSTGATITNFSATASAVLQPRQELVLGTPIEVILAQIVAGAGNSVKITGFGTDTGINGVDPGGGVLALLALTSQGLQGGSFAAIDILNYLFQWRGQQYTEDMQGLIKQAKRLLPTPNLNTLATVSGAGSAALQGIPYPVYNVQTDSPATTAKTALDNLNFWPLVLPGERCRLTSLQTADSDQTFNMTVNGGYSGSHQILGLYARSWQERMVANWVGQITAGDGGSLAAYVLGPNYTKAGPSRRAPAKHSLSNDQLRYLPWQFGF